MMERSLHKPGSANRADAIDREWIAPDVVRISLPYPGGFVNVYVLLSSDGFRMIDTGYRSDASRDALSRNFRELGLEVRSLRQILLTHAHPDHVGLAQDLAHASGAEVLVHELEVPGPGRPSIRRMDPAWIEHHGLDGAAAARLLSEPPVPATARGLNGTESLVFGDFNLRLIWVPGHSQGLICVYDASRSLLYSSDQVLRVSTPITLSSGIRPDPVAEYLKGMDLLRDLPVQRVLPGHGRSFSNLAAHIEQAGKFQLVLLRDVASRLDNDPRAAADIAGRMDWTGYFSRRLTPERLALFSGLRALAYLYHLVGISQAHPIEGRTVTFQVPQE
jgi:glyoxylase-like metal-dependent hydrolase (beta-lactamase superfamily II)